MKTVVIIALFSISSTFSAFCEITSTAVPKLCELPKDEGDDTCCDAQKGQRFYYNACSKRCEEFTYNGCNGNENRFTRKCQCEEACVKKAGNGPPVNRPPVKMEKGTSKPKLCQLPKKEGDNKCCDAKKSQMFYYNARSKRCEEFTYYGCNGNANRFERKCQCEVACVKKTGNGPPANRPPVKKPPPEKCSALPKRCGEPKKEGDHKCPGAQKRRMFYYNARSRRCEEFTYNGCNGNDNRFPQKCQCEDVCVNRAGNGPPANMPLRQNGHGKRAFKKNKGRRQPQKNRRDQKSKRPPQKCRRNQKLKTQPPKRRRHQKPKNPRHTCKNAPPSERHY